MRWIKKNLVNLLLILIFLAGVGLLLYPTVANYWNQFHETQVISNYAQEVEQMDDTEYEEMLAAAHAYNEKVAAGEVSWNMSEEELEEYNSTLNIGGSGVMGYIEIDKINVSLPIYHGTDDTILQIAVGHIGGSSLPVGGESTHCVLSGHRGLPSAKLFTDLDQMEVGDTFVIRTLDEVLTYEVDQILIVEPNDVSSLNIVEGEDLCTLVTCTPYGVNTHRLLVRGHRVANEDDADDIRVTSNAIKIEPYLSAPFMAAPVLFILLVYTLVKTRKKNRKKVPGKNRRVPGKKKQKKEQKNKT